MLGAMAARGSQTSVNVTNFGAKGDLLTLSTIKVTSNSTAIVCPGARFVAADTNKLIEVFGGGTWRGVSNETLITYISAVSSPSNITVLTPAGATGNGLTGFYGTDDLPAFSNAVMACSTPTATITIPAGNYLIVPRELINGYNGSYSPAALLLRRGGITFAGQGSVTLTGSGGWRNFGGNCERGATFGIQAPVTNDYPLVFTNLTLDGGVAVGNIRDLSWPTSGSTGIGWDGTHHWLVTMSGTSPMLSSIVMQNCVIQHWRGEMMEETTGAPNIYLTATNCVFQDGDGSCINNFAHAVSSCVFSNANQAEEFYRSYSTNTSFMSNCVLSYLGSAIALNGGYYWSPTYTIINNAFTNFYGSGYALMTTPACNVTFVSNNVYTAQGVALGVAGYQGGTINSNIVAAWNTFNGAQYPLQILGNGANLSASVYFFSNRVQNAWGLATGYGWATNVFVFSNSGSNCGSFYEPQFQGQYVLDANNQYTPTALGDTTTLTNIFTYAQGSKGQMRNGIATAKFALDDTQPAKIPSGATMVISNASNQAYSLYSKASLTGTPLTITSGQAVTFLWTNGTWQLANLPPPTGLHIVSGL